MITNFDIEELCKRLELPLRGIVNKDRLETLEKDLGSYYINMQNYDDGDGTHWVYARLYCDDDRDSDNDEDEYGVVKCLYFDPFGLDMPKEVAEYFKEFKPIAYSKKQIQNIRSTQCGWYCVACDYELTHRPIEKTYLEDYESFLGIWSDDPTENLKLLKAYFKPL
jgi:hypothetical protein